MGIFNNNIRKPRRYNHRYIYVDERKEKLEKMQEAAKRELGMLPPKEFNPEDIRGKFVEQTTHLKRRKQSGRRPMNIGIMIIILFLLIYFLHYLYTGSWNII